MNGASKPFNVFRIIDIAEKESEDSGFPVFFV